MSALHRVLVLVLLGSLLATGCGPAEPTATSVPATVTRIALEATNTPLPPTATPTPTATATAPPTATASPTTEPTLTTAPSEVEEIRFQSGHFTLVGDLQIPDTEGKHPAVVMVHGDGGIDRYDSGRYRPIMERFLRAGYAVFSWDKPGTGESSGEFVDGAWIITDRASILVDAVEFLKGHPAIDPQRIGVWGISQAGAVMPMALTMTDEFAFMIVVSGPGVDSIDQTAYLIGQQLLCQGYSEEEARLAEQSYASLCRATTYQEYRESKEYLIQFPYATKFVGREISPEEDWSPWDRDVDAFFNPMEVIERTTIPVLAFFGEKDTQVDPFQGAQAYEEALQKARNQHSHVELVPETDHNIVLSESGCMAARDRRSRADWLKYGPEYLDLMEEWLVQLFSSLPPLSGSGGGVIAFFSSRDGNDEIYVMNADGSDQRNLTNHQASDTDPSWSPDGSQIAFSSLRDGNYEIYVMDADGGNLRRLTDNPAIDANPIWSPDGSNIAFSSRRAGNSEIYMMDADGSDLQRLTRNRTDDFEIDWSPDGTQIAMSSQQGRYAHIFTINVQAALQGNTERQQLTDTAAYDAFPKWSPDGSRFAFISNREGDDNWEVYVMDADGSNQTRLTYSDGLDGIPDWSPDGTRIAFESNRDGDNEIYVLNVEAALQDPEGVELVRLTDNDANDQQPVWRPSDAAEAPILAQLEGLPLDQFLDQSYRLLQLREPDALVANGLADEYGVANDRFTDMSDDYVRQTQQLESGILDLLRTYDRSALPPDQQLSYDVYEWVLDDRVRGHQFTYCDYPVNSMTIWGKQNWLVDFMVNYLPISGRQDAEDYIARLSQIDTWVEQLLEGLGLREQAGAIPPREIVEGSRHQVEGHLQMQGTGSFKVEAIQLYTSFREKLEQVEAISADEAQVLLDAALTEIKDTFVPAFSELRDYLAHLETVATEKPAVCKLPGGEAYYAYMLRRETSTNTSPEQIHELGLAEVARLQAEIQEAAAEQGHPQDISLAELDERIRADSQLLRGDALLAEYQRLIAEADRAADAFFDLRPTTQVVIETEPFGSGIAYYTSPPLDGSGPGKFFTNLNSAALRYLMPTVTFHETIPGHHFQIALARELDLPTFRRELVFNAHAEGWALYAEQLAWEMGLYDDDPLGNLGRLELELARAARLVVDTGIHAKGWSAQVAADYYAEATGRPTDPSAMHRYIILPGQGCGYTIGLLKILELRQRAMDQLGDRFDIKEFHNMVLGNGSLPLEVLERVVQRYIEANPGGM